MRLNDLIDAFCYVQWRSMSKQEAANTTPSILPVLKPGIKLSEIHQLYGLFFVPELPSCSLDRPLRPHHRLLLQAPMR